MAACVCVCSDLDTHLCDLSDLFIRQVRMCAHVCVRVRASSPESYRSKIKMWVFEMPLIREGTTGSYFESCGRARPTHKCVHRKTDSRTHIHRGRTPLHFGSALLDNSSRFSTGTVAEVLLLSSIENIKQPETGKKLYKQTAFNINNWEALVEISALPVKLR